jgi:hypothetical protein
LFIARDWLDAASYAWAANGRVQLNRRLVDTVNNPRLFAVDFPLANHISPVTNLVVTFAGGGLNSHAMIFALSGSSSTAPPIVAARLTFSALDGGGWLVSSTAPGRLQSSTNLDAAGAFWIDEGQITTGFRLESNVTEPVRFYRVVSP